jgi:dTMP kinase
MTEMALMFADRAQAIAEVISPLSRPAKLSSATASPIRPKPTRAAAVSWARRRSRTPSPDLLGLQPDLTLLLLPSLEASLERARRRNQRAERKEARTKPVSSRSRTLFTAASWQKYREIAAREPDVSC